MGKEEPMVRVWEAAAATMVARAPAALPPRPRAPTADELKYAAEFERQIRLAEHASLMEMRRIEERRMEDIMIAKAQTESLEAGKKNDVRLAEEASRLASKASELSLMEVEVPRDGNCQFHCLAQAVSHASGRSLDHVQVRQEAISWLRGHESYCLSADDKDTQLGFYLDADPSWEAYCDRMSREGQYGDHLTLIAMAERFACCIVVVTSKEDGVNYHATPYETSPLDTVHMAHYPLALHYNLLTMQAPEGEDESADEAWAAVLGCSAMLGLANHLTTGFAYKVHCPNGQLRRVRTEYNAAGPSLKMGCKDLQNHVAKLSGVDPGHLVLRWRDVEGDYITFDTEQELLDAVVSAAAAGEKVVRIFAEKLHQEVDEEGCVLVERETPEDAQYCNV